MENYKKVINDDGYNHIVSVTIPNSVTTIHSRAFDGCDYITNINIPDSVIVIDDMAFCNCHSLASINVDHNNPYYTSIDGVLYNKDCTELLCYPAKK